MFATLLNYPKQVYKNWGYLYQASREAIWEQIALDPAQDAIIEWSFEKMVQYGHSAAEISLAKCCSGNFIQHWIPHLVQKTTATIIFPFIYPILNSSYISNIPGTSIVKESAAFFGVNPLEGLYSLGAIPKTLFGENNTISNTAEYLAFRENYHEERAQDDNFNEFMKSYKDFMEFSDALGHARSELTTLYKNRYLSSMPYKAYAYFRGKAYLYSNTIAEEAENDKKIEFYKLSLQKQTLSGEGICFANQTSHIYQNEMCPADHKLSWANWLYDNKWKITQEIAAPIIFKKIYSWALGYLQSHKLKTLIQDDKSGFSSYRFEDDDSYDDDHYRESPMLFGFDKQNLLWGMFKRKTDDQILEEAARILAPIPESSEYDDKSLETYLLMTPKRGAISKLKTSSSDSLEKAAASITPTAGMVTVLKKVFSTNDVEAVPSPQRDSYRAFSVDNVPLVLQPNSLRATYNDDREESPAIVLLLPDDNNDGSNLDDLPPLVPMLKPSASKTKPLAFCGDASSMVSYFADLALGKCVDPNCPTEH